MPKSQEGKITQHSPQYSAEHLIIFLEDILNLLWSLHLVSLKRAVFPCAYPVAPWNILQLKASILYREESYVISCRKRGRNPATHKPSKASQKEKATLHIQSLEMPNIISHIVAAYSTCGHLPPDWARLFISSTVFLRESWSDRDTNTGRMYLIRAEEKGKQKQANQPLFLLCLKKIPPPQWVVLRIKILAQVHNYYITLQT